MDKFEMTKYSIHFQYICQQLVKKKYVWGILIFFERADSSGSGSSAVARRQL
jgi:hypothetical protein